MDLPELSSNNKKSFPFEYFHRLNIFDLLVIIICVASFICSVIESMVNYDNQHWGWAYITALDIRRGAIPHSEVIIFYGYIYTWIQSVALILFGERLMSVGIITGLFYSLTLFLSYCVFLRFLKKSLAFMAVLLIFLIHPYIIYPVANYFAYTFQLLALIFFLRYSENRYNSFLAGFFLCLSLLSRYSSTIAILPPFIILLGWELFTAREAKKYVVKKIGFMGSGLLIPLILFFGYLSLKSALGDFFYQNKMIAKVIGNGDSIDTYLNFLASIFQFVPSLASDFRGKLFTLILIVCLFILVREIFGKISGGVKNSAYAHYDIMTVCIVAVFGYLNSIHVYETFRLVNGASLGVGICVLVFYNYFNRTIKPLKYLIAFTGIFVCLFLSSSLFFKTTTSSYYPWKRDVLCGNRVTNKNIGIFKGKILTKEYNNFYQEVFDTIAPFKNRYYILNYTQDLVAFSMNDLPRVQISPMLLPGVDDISKQAKLIVQKKALILSYKKLDLPGYSVIFAKKWPEEIPWMGGGYLFISVPKQ